MKTTTARGSLSALAGKGADLIESASPPTTASAIARLLFNELSPEAVEEAALTGFADAISSELSRRRYEAVRPWRAQRDAEAEARRKEIEMERERRLSAKSALHQRWYDHEHACPICEGALTWAETLAVLPEVSWTGKSVKEHDAEVERLMEAELQSKLCEEGQAIGWNPLEFEWGGIRTRAGVRKAFSDLEEHVALKAIEKLKSIMWLGADGQKSLFDFTLDDVARAEGQAAVTETTWRKRRVFFGLAHKTLLEAGVSAIKDLSSKQLLELGDQAQKTWQ